MGPKDVRRRWAVAGVPLLLAVVAGATVIWIRAAPPSPRRVFDQLREQHRIDLGLDQRGNQPTHDAIATEWGWLVMARSTLSPDAAPRSVVVRGWECRLRSPGEVDAGALLLGSGTIASASASTLSRRMPDGSFECESKTQIEDGPVTVLLVAVPTGWFERLRLGFD